MLDSESRPIIRYRTLWHEMLHGILLNAGYTRKDNSTEDVERMIRVLATGIVGILEDNMSVHSFQSFRNSFGKILPDNDMTGMPTK